MTKPSSSLPVLYARVPQATVALAQSLASRDGKSMTSWLIDLIETKRGTLGGQPLPPYAQPVKRGRGRPRKAAPIDREDGHARAAEAACSGDDQ